MSADLLEDSAPAKMTSADVRTALRKAYPAPEWALLAEVAPRTGGGTRYADAVAINLWQSRGHAIIGFEIKVQRGDWLRELKQPHKTEESVHRYCDTWIVVAPPGIVKPEELPVGWGLQECRTNGVHLKVAPTRQTAAPIDRAFFASLIRRAFGALEGRAAAMVREQIAAGRVEIDRRVTEEVTRRSRDSAAIRERAEKLNAELGYDLFGTDWTAPSVRMIQIAQWLEHRANWRDGQSAEQLMQSIAGQLEETASSIRRTIADATATEQPA